MLPRYRFFRTCFELLFLSNKKGGKVQAKLLLRPHADNGVYGHNFYTASTSKYIILVSKKEKKLEKI